MPPPLPLKEEAPSFSADDSGLSASFMQEIEQASLYPFTLLYLMWY